MKLRKKLLLLLILAVLFSGCASRKQNKLVFTKAGVLSLIEKVNGNWQIKHSPEKRAFWDNAVYHTGNMEAYFITKNEAYKKYSEDWAEYNDWMGAKSNNKAEWKYSYGESNAYVLFGDWQACFQTYIDLYRLDPEPERIARVREVMEHQLTTEAKDYWWWADGLYMVMPVMVKLHHVTKNQLYLDKLYDYWNYANSIMYDEEEQFYFRDIKYVYPKHKTINGKKDFWARGNGWAFAALAKVLQDLPARDPKREEYIDRFRKMAKSLKMTQQPGGYWTRSLLDSDHAPGPETSGTAFFTYGLFWGINHGFLDKEEFLPVAKKAWTYLARTAVQPDGQLGYVQPIGERAIPGQVVDKNSSANFGVGAFLLGASEVYRYLDNRN